MIIQLHTRTVEHVRLFWEKTQDPDIQRLFPFSTTSLEEAFQFFEVSCSLDAASYGRIIIYNGQYVGDIWCYGIDETVEKMAMLSIVLFEKSIWGNGVGTLAGAMFLQEIFQNYRIEKVGAFTYSSNIASIGLLKRLGFQEIEEFIEDGIFSKYYVLYGKCE
jgi:ribosomal-protein-alanine N-acetyltransferase